MRVCVIVIDAFQKRASTTMDCASFGRVGRVVEVATCKLVEAEPTSRSVQLGTVALGLPTDD